MNKKQTAKVKSNNPEPDIDLLRKRINELDKIGMNYFKERFEAAEFIAKAKINSDLPVYDPARESYIIDEFQKNFPSSMKHKIESIMTTVMRVSRENQYEILLENDNDWAIKNMINNADNNIFAPERIACQGTSGSYSHLASTDVFPDSYCVPVQTFEDSITLLLKGECELALLPLENTTAGTVNDVYDLITKNSIYIVKAVSVPIHHKLVVLPGANISKIRTVLSHPQALAQCSNYIKNKGWTQIAVENTAFAAQKMIEINDPSYCAIASSEAATINNLKIHDDDICDSEHNQTRFVALSKKFIIEDNADRISLSFKLPHQSGSLASVLNVFAERGLNMTKIQSRPVPERPWEYSFWVDLSARRGDENVLLALYQLSKELPFLQILGWYEECRVNR